MSTGSGGLVFGMAPDPGQVRTMGEFIAALRALKASSGDPSISAITRRIHRAWTAAGRPAGELPGRSTVGNCFRIDRTRPSEDLVLAIVEALCPDATVVAQWRQAFRVVRGEAGAASFVQAQDRLPDDIAEFTGRENHIARLIELADTGAAGVISAIEGMAGVGKTQLAIRLGHRLIAECGIEQVLFVNLRGFHDNPNLPAVDPAAVLDSFLRLLGVPGQDIPHDPDKRAAMYRRRLRDRRALVVLDNAADAAQVRPLLPDSAGCLTLITSRHTLHELSEAEHLRLAVFTPDEAAAFLRRTIGTDRVDAEPAAVAGVIGECGWLPLALRLTASRINANPDWTLTDHLERLTRRREDLRLDDALDTALSLSYHDLPPPQQRLLRLLSLHPGDDLDTPAVAAVAGADPATTQHQLDQLLADHLLQQKTSGRYQLHDLIRAYATARAHDEDRGSDRSAALTRLVDHYLHTARMAMDLAYPQEKHRRPKVPTPATVTMRLSDAGAARSWLDTERANLLVIATHPAASHDRPAVAIVLAAILHRHLLTGGHYPDAQSLHRHAVTIAQQQGDRAGHATALTNLGAVYWRLGWYEQADDHLRQALALCRDLRDRHGQACALGNLGIVYTLLGRYDHAADHHRQDLVLCHHLGDRYGQANALANLGTVYGQTGEYEQAADHFRQALPLFREVGDRYGQAMALTNLGIVHQRLGRNEQAVDHYRQASALFRDVGDLDGQAHTLVNVGTAYERLGRYEQAADNLQQALALFRDLSNPQGLAHALTNLGEVYRRLGRYQQAADHQRQALALFHDVGDPAGQAEVLNDLGETALAAGDLAQALAAHTEAHQHANTIGVPIELARAHAGLGHTHYALGNPGKARQHWQQALTLYDELGVPEADDVRIHLTTVDTSHT